MGMLYKKNYFNCAVSTASNKNLVEFAILLFWAASFVLIFRIILWRIFLKIIVNIYDDVFWASPPPLSSSPVNISRNGLYYKYRFYPKYPVFPPLIKHGIIIIK